MVWLPEGVGEKSFLESCSPTFRIDSSGKDMRRTGLEGPDWSRRHKRALDRKEEFVVNVIRVPFDYVGNQKRMVWLPERVGEKGFLENPFPTSRIDSSGKDMRRTGLEGPDWRQKA
ncbi:hypothetical protein TNCV_3138571 [Trichonephila clavipes]|nr:hypothetical protein TNCV_3138571 [Trichonephila clavipes]